MSESSLPRLTDCFRLSHRAKIRSQVVSTAGEGEYRFIRYLLAPESSYPLEFSEAAVLLFCDGRTSLAQLISSLAQYFNEQPTEAFASGIKIFIRDLIDKRLLVAETSSSSGEINHSAALDDLWSEYSAPCTRESNSFIPRGLLAEVSYRCP